MLTHFHWPSLPPFFVRVPARELSIIPAGTVLFVHKENQKNFRRMLRILKLPEALTNAAAPAQLKSRHRIVAATAPRMATQQAAHCQIKSSK